MEQRPVESSGAGSGGHGKEDRGTDGNLGHGLGRAFGKCSHRIDDEFANDEERDVKPNPFAALASLRGKMRDEDS